QGSIQPWSKGSSEPGFSSYKVERYLEDKIKSKWLCWILSIIITIIVIVIPVLVIRILIAGD
ncbi:MULTISPECIES: hypothetical protein, partial [Bacteroidales]|uniref:hypothetical protein n=1 Tax=Bacteroidales TaxID=171549 RepID=UPI00258BF7D4